MPDSPRIGGSPLSQTAMGNGVPAPPTSFVGRHEELDYLDHALKRGAVVALVPEEDRQFAIAGLTVREAEAVSARGESARKKTNAALKAT